MLQYRKDSATPNGQWVYNGKNVDGKDVVKLFDRLEQALKYEQAQKEELKFQNDSLQLDRNFYEAAMKLREAQINKLRARI